MTVSKKIVLLEDDRSTSRLLSSFLEKSGYTVIESAEARFAIELTLREKPDLLIADIMLPDMNGSEAVKKLMSVSSLPDMKVLFLTSLLGKVAKPGEETKLKVDGKDFPALAKPIEPDSLIAIVDRITGGNN